MSDGLDEYILRHIDAEGNYLHALWRDTQLRLAYGQMASGHLQGRMLKMLVRMIRPRRLLELGTFSGYSALSMAEGLEDGAELHIPHYGDDDLSSRDHLLYRNTIESCIGLVLLTGIHDLLVSIPCSRLILDTDNDPTDIRLVCDIG